MPDSESFDAFYARTVWSVTSQMHALADGDSAADHAIREAYARAYQQWYEISTYPDTQGWVLAVAQEAYQRRRPATQSPAPAPTPASTGHDPLSWPGLFRPVTERRPGAAADSGATMARPAEPVNAGVGLTSGQAGDDTVSHVSGLFGSGAGRSGGTATAELAGDRPAAPGSPAAPGRRRPGPLPIRVGRLPLPSRRVLVTLAAVVALIVAGAVYLVVGAHPGGQAADRAAGSSGSAAVHMLAAGQTGSRSAVPWSIVGQGWTLADVSTAPADADGGATGIGSLTTFLVDPEGGRYVIQTQSAAARPQLLAWSGDAQNALFAVPGGSGNGVSYQLLSLRTGSFVVLPLPVNVTAVGFTRPDGLNILAVQSAATSFQLERFNLQGAYQATIGSLPRKAGVSGWQQGCGGFCGALSSPDGTTAVWGVNGDEMQLVDNASEPLIRTLDVPDSGSPPSCVPLTWWDAETVLAYCAASHKPYPAGRLWLVPANGNAATALTTASGSSSGSGVVTGAWQAAGSMYVTSTDSVQCHGAASGPGGLALRKLSPNGSLHRVAVQGATGNYTSVVSAAGGRLLVLAQMTCPGTSSLLWVNPATGTAQQVLTGQAGDVGVVAAVALGTGPTAITNGEF